MGQEWDYPPSLKWKPEIKLLPGAKPEFRRFDRTIEHQKMRHKTGWAWYKAQMQGGGSALYKLNLTALYFTLCGVILAVVAIIAVVFGLLISNIASAAELPQTDSQKYCEAISGMFNGATKDLMIKNCLDIEADAGKKLIARWNIVPQEAGASCVAMLKAGSPALSNQALLGCATLTVGTACMDGSMICSTH